MLRELATTVIPYIKLKTYKTVVTVDTLEKWKRRPKPRPSTRQVTFGRSKSAALAVGTSAKPEARRKSVPVFHAIHNPSTANVKENCA